MADWNQAVVGRLYATGKRWVIRLSEKAEKELKHIVVAWMTAAIKHWTRQKLERRAGSKPSKSSVERGGDPLPTEDSRREGEEAERLAVLFNLFYVQGLSATEIAKLPSVNMSVKAVENILLQITRRLQRITKSLAKS